MQGGLLHMSHSILMVFNPILCYLSPKIVIFQEPLITETSNKWNWIWHALNSKYMHHSSHFDAFFPVKINKMWNFWLSAELLMRKKRTKIPSVNWNREKSVWKGLNICTYRFVGMPIAMHYVRTLCDKYFLSYYGFSWFVTGRSKYRVLKHVVGVEWDQRRTAA